MTDERWLEKLFACFPRLRALHVDLHGLPSSTEPSQFARTFDMRKRRYGLQELSLRILDDEPLKSCPRNVPEYFARLALIFAAQPLKAFEFDWRLRFPFLQQKSFTSLPQHGLIDLISCIEYSHLRSLGMFYSEQTGVIPVNRSLPRLQKLDLAHHNLRADEFAELLPQLDAITDLDLSFSAVTATTLPLLFSSLPQLKMLNVNGSIKRLNDKAWLSLKKGGPSLKTLRCAALPTSKATLLTITGVRRIVSLFSHLRCLDLSHHRKIDAECVCLILSSLPRLQLLDCANTSVTLVQIIDLFKQRLALPRRPSLLFLSIDQCYKSEAEHKKISKSGSAIAENKRSLIVESCAMLWLATDYRITLKVRS